MFHVEVFEGNAPGPLTLRGTIDFWGVEVHSPGGGRRFTVGEGGEPVPYRVVQNPGGFVGDEVVRQIRGRLEIGHVVGSAEGYEWRAAER